MVFRAIAIRWMDPVDPAYLDRWATAYADGTLDATS